MNYPVWELFYAGGGLLIALIAVFHVYVAHFAVGGGLFLVLTEMKGLRENSPDVIGYVQKHSKFFLLVTMVASALTGVGIWFTISLLSPSATSHLIHLFVFGFAAEWVFFTLEIVAIFIYFYMFGKIENKAHLTIGWLYFIFALISLVLINGIISFMLTPGDWIETRNFWDGFFNPSFFPSLFFRITLALVFAGLFGFVTSVFIKDTGFKEKMVKYCAKWLIMPFAFMVLFAWWYLLSLPDAQTQMILGRSTELVNATRIFVFLLPVLFFGGLFMSIRTPGKIKRYMAFLLLLIGLFYMGSFEWIREAGRRPYLIYDYLYSNSIQVEDKAEINDRGILKTARWAKHKEFDENSVHNAGAEIFKIECMCCHSVGGPLNDILPLTEKFTVFGMDSQLDGQGKISTYMPEFMGTGKERLALARYIVERLHNKNDTVLRPDIKKQLLKIPPFDETADEFVLLAWSNTGMNHRFEAGKWFTLSDEKSIVTAQLIKRGELPEIITEGVTLSYRSAKEKPENNLYKNSHIIGEMKPVEEKPAFESEEFIPDPYTGNSTFNPYPIFIIEARDKDSKKLLVKTKTVVPVSTEMGCRKCHGGGWRKDNKAGISDETAKDILRVHDRLNRTRLLAMAKKGSPVSCKSCHGSFGKLEKATSAQLNLSASLHGFHANYLTNRGAGACSTCHPSSLTGHTQFFRGIHNEIGLDCTSCHGSLEDHALSLLAAEKDAGKASAEKLMKHLVPTMVASTGDIKKRVPWINQPDCLNCHTDFSEPEAFETFNWWTESEESLYRSRSDDAGVMCQACHGTAHAIYPAKNIYGDKRDNIQPLQYQGNPYPMAANKNCRVCHTIDMDTELHHPNSLRMFRNTQ